TRGHRLMPNSQGEASRRHERDVEYVVPVDWRRNIARVEPKVVGVDVLDKRARFDAVVPGLGQRQFEPACIVELGHHPVVVRVGVVSSLVVPPDHGRDTSHALRRSFHRTMHRLSSRACSAHTFKAGTTWVSTKLRTARPPRSLSCRRMQASPMPSSNVTSRPCNRLALAATFRRNLPRIERTSSGRRTSNTTMLS